METAFLGIWSNFDQCSLLWSVPAVFAALTHKITMRDHTFVNKDTEPFVRRLFIRHQYMINKLERSMTYGSCIADLG